MKRAIWVLAALELVACGWDDPVTRRTADQLPEAGAAGAAQDAQGGAAGAAVLPEAGGGGSEAAGAPGDDAGADSVAGSPVAGAGGAGRGGAGPEPAAGGSSAGQPAGGAAGAQSVAGAAGKGPTDPDCLPSNLHPLPRKCTKPQPVDCQLGLADNPNLCTGGPGVCPDNPAIKCQSFPEDYVFCRDGRFRSCPAGTCGTDAGTGCRSMESDVPTEYCPCVVMGVMNPAPYQG
jgi:hypothetical protein